MSGEFVRSRIEKTLHILASPAADQEKYLERLGSSPSADELALELDDFVGLLPVAIREGVVSEEQAAAIRDVSDFTESFGGRRNAALWRVDQLDSAWQWKEVRRLAQAALHALGSGGTKK